MSESPIEGDTLKAAVAVSSTTLTFDKIFSYLVPERLRGSVQKGMRAAVPFGKGNRKLVGMIMEVSPALPNEKEKLKSLITVYDKEPVLSEEMLGLVEWLRDNTFCTYFDGVRAMLPSGMNINIREHYSLVPNPPTLDKLTSEHIKALEFLENSPNTDSAAEQLKSLGKGRYLKELTDMGALKYSLEGKQNVGDSTVKVPCLTVGYKACPESFKLTPKQKALVEVIEKNPDISVKEVCYLAGVGTSVEKKLLEKGVIEEKDYEVFRRVPSNEEKGVKPQDVVLSPDQQKVFDRAAQVMEERKAHCFLLHGVTGSGKTAVFEKLIDRCVKSGRQALLLVPEIALTPQMVNRFRGLFGETVAVIHSSLSLGQRMDEYKRIKRGLAKIAIGTRSAVFAPFDNLGLIVMDEEGESSYKSDSAPRYSAIEVAKKRCRTHEAVLLLASATPSIESYYYAQKGIYELLELNRRYSGAKLPDVCIVDMNEERESGNVTEFSCVLVDEINKNLKNKEQTILLLNRRGYHTIISCVDCRKPIYCPNCSIPMTYHKPNGMLMCHYCGHGQALNETCPECGSTRLKQLGFGTQKLEEQISKLFPEAKILRMDADTTMSRYSYEKNFKDFGDGKYDIMVGTQMIGKGLDFPNVTLVGILSVDKALYVGNFRSYEKTFSLTAQVAGRCGRGEKKGRAYLQTFVPDHYVLTLAARQDYKAFYEEEAAMRKALLLPPFCDICTVLISGIDDKKTENFAKTLLSVLKEIISEGVKLPLRVLGPVKCSYEKINGKYRYRMLIKCKNTQSMRDLIRQITERAAKNKPRDISFYFDMNGDTAV